MKTELPLVACLARAHSRRPPRLDARLRRRFERARSAASPAHVEHTGYAKLAALLGSAQHTTGAHARCQGRIPRSAAVRSRCDSLGSCRYRRSLHWRAGAAPAVTPVRLVGLLEDAQEAGPILPQQCDPVALLHLAEVNPAEGEAREEQYRPLGERSMLDLVQRPLRRFRPNTTPSMPAEPLARRLRC